MSSVVARPGQIATSRKLCQEPARHDNIIVLVPIVVLCRDMIRDREDIDIADVADVVEEETCQPDLVSDVSPA